MRLFSLQILLFQLEAKFVLAFASCCLVPSTTQADCRLTLIEKNCMVLGLPFHLAHSIMKLCNSQLRIIRTNAAGFFFILPLFHFEQLYQLMGNFLNTIQCNLSFRIEFCRFCRNFFPSMRVSLFLLCLCHCTLFLSSIFSL